jgi:hypothetical protein
VAISLYQDLFNYMYVGNAANETADWWYRCDEAGNRTTSGAYVRVADKKGLFSRAYGTNSKYKMANNAPYDGGSIGTFINDAAGNIRVFFSVALTSQYDTGFHDDIAEYGNEQSIAYGGGSASQIHKTFTNPSTPKETRPASISYYPCIKY